MDTAHNDDAVRASAGRRPEGRKPELILSPFLRQQKLFNSCGFLKLDGFCMAVLL